MSAEKLEVTSDTLEYLRRIFAAADGKERTVIPFSHLSIEGGHRPTMLLHPHEKLTDLSGLMLGKLRYTGTYATSSIPALVSYVESFPSEIQLLGFVNPESMACKVYLDVGNKDSPGRGEHTARVALTKNAFYSALLKISDTRLSQKAMAEFLEDWSGFWRAPLGPLKDGETVRLASAENPFPEFSPTSLPMAIKAIRGITVDTQGKKDSIVGNAKRELTENEKVEARAAGDYPLPETLLAVCKPYDDLLTRHIGVRLSIVFGKEGEPPSVVPRIVAQEALVESMADEFCALVAEKFEGAVKVIKGVFDVGS